MRTLSTMLLLATLALSTGCATLKQIGDVVIGPTAPFTAEFCVGELLPLRCTNLGEVPVPAEGEAFSRLAVQLGGPYLLREFKLKSCLFTTYPQSTDRAIVVTGTASCQLEGVTVERTVVLTLTPVPPPPVA